MPRIQWNQNGERRYETGVDRGVLYSPNAQGDYATGVPWNGLVSVTESPSGAEATPQYADNIKYLNLVSAEQFGGTIEAFTYPREFEKHDGLASPTPGVTIGQQNRLPFGLAYRTLVGNDTQGTDLGYKLHLVYGCLAAPTEKGYTTVNDTPEAITFSWELTTTPVEAPGFKPTATLTIDTTLVPAAKITQLENILYGTTGTDPRLPLPAEVFTLIGSTVTLVRPTAPTYNATTKVITIPAQTGVVYLVDGKVVPAGALPAITKDTVVDARPASGYQFTVPSDTDWLYLFS